MINILADRKKKKKKRRVDKQASDKYTHFQRIVLLFQLSQKITISKVVLYISENYNQQRHSSHWPTPSQGKNHKKGKEKKEKEKEGERENEGEGEREKGG